MVFGLKKTMVFGLKKNMVFSNPDFEQLLNDEFENDIDVVLYTEGHVKHITEFGMQKVIQGMKIGELRDRHICEC